MGWNTDLFPSKQGIIDEACIGQLMARQGVGLGNTAGVRVARLAEVGVGDVVAGAIVGAPGVFVAHTGKWGMGQVILST